MTQLKKEKENLEKIIKTLESQIDSLYKRKYYLENDVKNMTKQFNEDTSWVVDFEEGNAVDSAQGMLTVQSRNQEINKIEDKIKEYTILLKKPYFGKVTLDNDEDIYIGNSTVKDPEGDILIYDWRTPIASVFYENRLGDVKYYIDESRNMTVNVTSRIQFIIEKGILIDIFENDSYIGDSTLIDLMRKENSNKLKNVVSTIQSEQNKVIRQPLNKNTVVYGPPGSGKTTIAIQRLAYLLYNNRHQLSNEELMLFLPNELFNDYVSDALPELGEKNVQYNTFMRLVQKIPYFKNKKIESLTTCIQRVNESNVSATQYQKKSSLNYLTFVKKNIEKLAVEGMHFIDFSYNNKVLVSKEELNRIFYSKSEGVSFKKRVNIIKKHLTDIYKKEYRKIAKQKYKELNNKDNYIGEKDELIQLAKSYTKNKLKYLRENILTYQFIDIFKIYTDMLDESAITFYLKENKQVLFDDLPPLILILLHFVEYKISDIKHIIIDEIQDYSNIQFEVIKKIYPNATFTLLGDRNQTLFPGKLDKLNDKCFQKLFLNKSYRSTTQINQYLENIIPTNLVSMGRNGEEVLEIETKNFYRELINLISKSKVKGKIAIITPSMDISIKIDEYLSELLTDQFKLIREEDTLLHDKNIILPYYLAKGFEYDSVISINNNIYRNKHIKYIIGSRAIDKLVLFTD